MQHDPSRVDLTPHISGDGSPMRPNPETPPTTPLPHTSPPTSPPDISARLEFQRVQAELNSPEPNLGGFRRAILILGRVGTWAVFSPPRAGLRAWASLRPTQQLVIGFAAYVALGILALSLPWAQRSHVGFLDNLFTAVSAVSTTGLTTVAVSSSYTFFGQLVILLLFQAGGIGFMTLSSVLIIARGRSLSESRLGVLRAGFAVPRYFVMQHFLVQVVTFTAIVQAVGAAILWWRFSALGLPDAAWSAIFHSVSAFATAGFSLYPNSLEALSADWVVNLTIAALCYLGAMGFIVVQDVWYSLKFRERMLTFTSKVILWMTAAIFILGTALVVILEPSIATLPLPERLLTAAFQVMSASTTAGFNSIPIGAMAPSAIVVLLIAMLIGASPSGTGGGIKTTSLSAILGNIASVLRGRRTVVWLGHDIPLPRVLWAFAAASLYVMGVILGTLVLAASEDAPFLPLVFEAVSAIATVGLSMGITSDLSILGKVTIIALMFVGRCGPLTIGLALLRPAEPEQPRPEDLAV